MALWTTFGTASGRLENAVGLQAGGADLDSFHSSPDTGTGILKVREPTPTRPVMRVTDVVSADRLFAAHITHFCHS